MKNQISLVTLVAFSVLGACVSPNDSTLKEPQTGDWEWQPARANGQKDKLIFTAAYNPQTGKIIDGNPKDRLSISGCLNGTHRIAIGGHTWQNIGRSRHTSAGHGPKLNAWIGTYTDTTANKSEFVLRRLPPKG